jgi:hypothetical protein
LRFSSIDNLIVVVLRNLMVTELGCQTFVQVCRLLERLRLLQRMVPELVLLLVLQSSGNLRAQRKPKQRS